ncbi:L-seryl-tRNA(Sec) selenium transferase [Gordonibacter sp.]|uniref:L-seryl-tRNA(Sec) selenium transferase n=1 Tax=Gordonibacter sp. TaxID=1968902 RepID=UPI002FCAFD94
MPPTAIRELLRTLPKVEDLLHAPCVEALAGRVPRPLIVEAVRAAVDQARVAILEGARTQVDTQGIERDACSRALALGRPSLRRVINASGVIIHTNLGRSALAPAAVQAACDVARGYSTLEYDTSTLARGSRHDHCERLICALTGAEAAVAVNNNAAAVMLVLSEFAAGHEAVVSRGELVEIGGSFRVPDIMALSHAQMVEVGTTNKTHVADYARAIQADTSMLLKVHPSNYRMIGFTESVDVRELRRLADAENERRHAGTGVAPAGTPDELLVYEDQGSGVLVHLATLGEHAEPTVADSVARGCDLVSFSGDKLLGGPQAGIVVGAKRHIDRLKANPLARALRLDKMTLAALEATLRLYLDGERAASEVPTLRMLVEPAETVRLRAEKLAEALTAALPPQCAALSLVEEVGRAGGGALPMCDIPTWAVRVEFLRGDALSCERYLVSEREVPVVGRIKRDALLLDARTILEGEGDEIARAVASYFEEGLA